MFGAQVVVCLAVAENVHLDVAQKHLARGYDFGNDALEDGAFGDSFEGNVSLGVVVALPLVGCLGDDYVLVAESYYFGYDDVDAVAEFPDDKNHVVVVVVVDVVSVVAAAAVSVVQMCQLHLYFRRQVGLWSLKILPL